MNTLEKLEEIISHADNLQSLALEFTHPQFEDFYPEWSNVFSRCQRIEELANELKSNF